MPRLRTHDWIILATAPAMALAIWLLLGLRSFGILGAPSTDVAAYFWDVRRTLGEAYQMGQIPWWSSQVFGGTPFMANPQTQGFYPLQALLAFLPVSWVMNLQTLTHLWLSGFGTGILARSRRIRLSGAVLAAVIVPLSAPALGRVFGGHIQILAALAWMPWGLWLGDGILRGYRPARWAVGLGLVTALATLSGHPQSLALGAILALIWFLGTWMISRNPPPTSPNWGLRAALLVLGPGLGMMVAGLQWVPSLEYVLEGSRNQFTLEDRLTFSLVPFHLWEFLYPGRHWDPRNDQYWGAWYPWEMGVFLGFPALILAGIGAIRVRGKSLQITAWTSSLLVLLTLCYSLGSVTPVFGLLSSLPGLDGFRGPARILIYLPIFVALLAGMGLSHLARIERIRRTAPAILAGLILTGLLTLGLIGLGRISNQDVLAQAQGLPPGSDYETVGQKSKDPGFTAWATNQANRSAIRGGLVAGFTCLGILAAMGMSRPRRRPVLLSLVLLQVAHGAYEGRDTARVYRPEPPNWNGAPPETQSRIYVLDPRRTPNNFLGTAHGSPAGYDPMFPQVHGELLNAVAGRRRDQFAGGQTFSDPAKVAQVIGITHVLRAGTIQPLPTGLGGPRATLHHQVQWVQSDEEGWQTLAKRWAGLQPRQPDLEPPVVVLGEGHPPKWAAPDSTPVTSHTVSGVRLTLEASPTVSDRLTVKLDPPSTGVLVLRDTFLKGWKASAQGIDLPIRKANIAFRALVLDHPTSQVDWSYEPPGWFRGLALTCAGLAGLLSLLVLGLRQPRTKSGFVPGPPENRNR